MVLYSDTKHFWMLLISMGQVKLKKKTKKTWELILMLYHDVFMAIHSDYLII